MTVAELMDAHPGEVGWVVTDPQGQVVDWGPVTVAEMAGDVAEMAEQMTQEEIP